MADAGSELSGRHPGGPRRRDRIMIGGSAGSLDTLRAIARHFPAEFRGSIFVVAHIGQSRSTLPDLLRKAGRLSASHPQEEEPIRSGHIYVAPPDRHLLIEHGKVCLSRGPPRAFYEAGDRSFVSLGCCGLRTPGYRCRLERRRKRWCCRA